MTQYREAQAVGIRRQAVTICPTLETPNSFKSRNGGIGFFHINARSLIAKMDFIQIWACQMNTDIFYCQ